MNAPPHTPDDRRYAPTHEWVLLQADGQCLVGISAHAQAQLGDLVFVGDVQVGTHLQAGAVAAVVESVKTASDLHAPVAGEITAFNERLATQPEAVNDAPYDAWIFKFKPDRPADLDALLDAAGYRKLAGES